MCQTSNPSMLPRFEGPDGKTRLAETLKRQVLINGDEAIALAIAEKSSLVEAMPSQVIITQGDTDTDLYFIISGTVSININGRVIATRTGGNHIGELALVDQTVRRSATIVANEPCVLVKISEQDFSSIAQNNQKLWRTIAIEIGNRLRERSQYIKQPHSQPLIFVGSSSEQVEIAREIQSGLAHDPMVVNVWTDSVFQASRTSIENLMRAVAEADFAVLVIAPEDHIVSRETEYLGPRDNVLFELGLFMGGIGRERTLIVKPRGIDTKLPSDLLGVTPIDYATGDDATLISRIAPVCTEIRRIVTKTGPK
jgi:CRP/FNR family cyclic AMP-dependent transcriptional regulator